MVLEVLIGEVKIRKKPYLILPFVMLITITGIFFAYWLFPNYSSILSVAFVTIGLVPMLYNIITVEESDEMIERKSCTTFFARHFSLIMIFIFVFFGVILAFSMAYVFAPVEIKETLFKEQINSFCWVTGSCKNLQPLSLFGNAVGTGAEVCKDPTQASMIGCTSYIFINNAKVLFFAIVLSLLYGAGSIFIIVWNASILGLFFGEMFLIDNHLAGLGLLNGLLIGHGPPELLGYVFGALAGAILSAMVAKGELYTHEFSTIIKDVIFLIILSFASVLYGAIVEAVGIIGGTLSIPGMNELYFILGFIYVVAIIFIVFTYGTKRKKGNFTC
ncbi:MAG: hypothetical protein PHQ98_00760 [Candidatus ainarchaeum sp.]|nr:hypothetical protein [Candidatus ainarchaeum sp.]